MTQDDVIAISRVGHDRAMSRESHDTDDAARAMSRVSQDTDDITQRTQSGECSGRLVRVVESVPLTLLVTDSIW